MEEGVVKYKPYCEGAHQLEEKDILDINNCRQYFYENNWIGQDAAQIGFGNISKRYKNGFIISATQTGKYEHLSTKEYALVTNWDIRANRLSFLGEKLPSSEALSHAAIYKNKAINVVVHFHDASFWQENLWKLPTTPASIPYGSPAMGEALIYCSQNILYSEIVLMAGHNAGVIIFAHNFDEIFEKMCQTKIAFKNHL
jgi:hypothetical protein